MLLKNTLNLIILAKYNRNKKLTNTNWNIINFISIFEIINLINKIISISNIKLVN